MPELPEVETTRRGVEPLVVGKEIVDVVIRNASLRQPVPHELPLLLQRQRFISVERRAKYLIFTTSAGALLVHLGMSGSLRVVDVSTALAKHDHVDIVFADGGVLRYRDARRFGLMLWAGHDSQEHPLLTHLGPEPLGDDFNGEWLFRRSRNRRVAVKSFLMDQKVVVGVGNIYASEALFISRIHPQREAGSISLRRFDRLATTVKQVLSRSIDEGGTTLRDFSGPDGNPGYFRQSLNVYGRAGEPCPLCGRDIRQRVIGQRSSFFCGHCQR